METQLYGGAITIQKLPESVIDISQFRQVPNNQECFMHQNPQESTLGKYDESLIFDLLESVTCSDIKEAMKLHLDDLFDEKREDYFVEEFEGGCFTYVILKEVGYKKVEVDNPKLIVLFFCLIRLEKVNTDVLIQYNVPLRNVRMKPIDFNGTDDEEGERLKGIYTLFRQISMSLKVKDWSLFG